MTTESKASFLGTGWAFPLAFSAGGGEVSTVSDEEDIFQSLQILLSTSLGERVMQEDYGCNLRDFVFEELSQGLLQDLRNAITNAIRYHETRITLDDINFDVRADMEYSTIYIGILFRVRSTNSRYNMVSD